MEEKAKEIQRPLLPPSSLPPAGDAQREELKQRADQLQEKAEEQFKDVGKIDPAKLEPDNEILGPISQQPDLLGVTNAKAGFRYKWVYTGFNGFFINDARLQGWVPVQGNDPEAKERVWTDTTRKLGDTLLFRTSEANYLKIQQQDFLKRMRQQESITSTIEEMAERSNGSVKVHKGVSNPSQLRRLGQQDLAKRIAESKFEEMLRAGKVPGMEIAEKD